MTPAPYVGPLIQGGYCNHIPRTDPRGAQIEWVGGPGSPIPGFGFQGLSLCGVSWGIVYEPEVVKPQALCVSCSHRWFPPEPVEPVEPAVSRRVTILTLVWNEDVPASEARRLSRAWGAKISEKPVLESVRIQTEGLAE